MTTSDAVPSNPVDWATAVVGEAVQELTCVTLIYHSSDSIYESSAQSTKYPGSCQMGFKLCRIIDHLKLLLKRNNS